MKNEKKIGLIQLLLSKDPQISRSNAKYARFVFSIYSCPSIVMVEYFCRDHNNNKKTGISIYQGEFPRCFLQDNSPITFLLCLAFIVVHESISAVSV